MSLKTKIHRVFNFSTGAIQAFGKPKIFCVGRNKTGTTSLTKALTEMGITVAEQYLAEKLIHDWARRDFQRLALYCHTAQAFQDVPFSWDDTFRAMDTYFPGSKFILTLRDTPEQWYNSLVNFHAKVFGNGQTVTLDDLRRSAYIYPGWAYEAHQMRYNTPEDDPYNEEILIRSYLAHNQAVMEYFRDRQKDLLVLNVSQPKAYDQLCDFLGKPRTGRSFPWENKTSDLVDS